VASSCPSKPTRHDPQRAVRQGCLRTFPRLALRGKLGPGGWHERRPGNPPLANAGPNHPRIRNGFGKLRGVAIHRQGRETVLVSELEAGWYRYVSRWRFHDDGTIRPRFGFSAVEDSCVCNVHHHHVYWRFDFDIGTRENNVVREFNSPPIFPRTPGTPTGSRLRVAEGRTSAEGGRSGTRRPVTPTT
jgi:hypothetical protein